MNAMHELTVCCFCAFV